MDWTDEMGIATSLRLANLIVSSSISSSSVFNVSIYESYRVEINLI